MESTEKFLKLKSGFLTALEASEEEEKERRSRDIKNMPRYGIKFLDDACYGILPSELIVIGADTGIGKTQIANDLAFQNAHLGKKVYLFSLEGDKNEVIARARWKSICHEYYKNPNGKQMNYQKYLMNQIEEIENYDKSFKTRMMQLGTNLNIFDRKMTLDIHALSEKISRIENANLIVIDHLHYLSLEDGVEHNQLTEVMRAIKDMTEVHGIPIVVISHLRKKTKDRSLLPDNEDFHGTSNIPKIASTCITISSWPELDSGELSATLFRITKSRMGVSKKYIGCVYFNLKLNHYNNSYTLYQIKKDKLEPLEYSDYPNWAHSS